VSLSIYLRYLLLFETLDKVWLCEVVDVSQVDLYLFLCFFTWLGLFWCLYWGLTVFTVLCWHCFGYRDWDWLWILGSFFCLLSFLEL